MQLAAAKNTATTEDEYLAVIRGKTAELFAAASLLVSLAVVPVARPKGLALRLAELVLMYFIVGGLGLLLERRAGQIASQGWEFYAITGALFLTLAFPGFIWRYLVKHRG